MTHRGPFQPLLFCDSVNTKEFFSSMLFRCNCMWWSTASNPLDICQPTSEALKFASCLGSVRTAGYPVVLLSPWRTVSIQGSKAVGVEFLWGWKSLPIACSMKAPFIVNSYNQNFYHFHKDRIVYSSQNVELELSCMHKLVWCMVQKSASP